MDRIQTQEEIQLLITSVFGDKKRINHDDYVKINQEITSEMFLSILTLLQTNLPCSVNFYRYKNNYEMYLGNDESGQPPTIKQLSSPRIMARLSPINNLAKAQGLNLNPKAQNSLIKYVVNNNEDQDKDGNSSGEDDDEDEKMDVSKFESKKKLKDKKAQRKIEMEKM